MSQDNFRTESDTLGPVQIPKDAAWGPQTERSRHNFTTGPLMPLSVVIALIQIKQAAAGANLTIGKLSNAKADAIKKVTRHLLALAPEKLRQDFPLVVYQTGSGTQTNMNVNEVIAHLANEDDPNLNILPNDDVNLGQSSNDVFPTAMNLAAIAALSSLKASLKQMITELSGKQKEFQHVVKIGRTHLQDATPLTFGQELSGYVAALSADLAAIERLEPMLYELPIGGTAVGTGLNTTKEFADLTTKALGEIYQVPLSADNNKFAGLANHSGLNVVHGSLKTLAADLLKIANDIRFLASGPRAGYDELNIPANEPGSSIMPGKVNPTQAEALTMACVRVMGNDTTITVASSQGNFEMNVYKPVLIETFLESADLLTGTINGFITKLLQGLTVNQKRMTQLVDQSLMTVTALSPHIGYHKSAEIAQLAEKEDLTLKQAALKTGYLTEADFDKWVNPLKMTNSQN